VETSKKVCFFVRVKTSWCRLAVSVDHDSVPGQLRPNNIIQQFRSAKPFRGLQISPLCNRDKTTAENLPWFALAARSRRQTLRAILPGKMQRTQICSGNLKCIGLPWWRKPITCPAWHESVYRRLRHELALRTANQDCGTSGCKDTSQRSNTEQSWNKKGQEPSA
jgi:hypothetical protein